MDKRNILGMGSNRWERPEESDFRGRDLGDPAEVVGDEGLDVTARMMDTQREIMHRLVRIETRLCRLMDSLGIRPDEIHKYDRNNYNARDIRRF